MIQTTSRFATLASTTLLVSSLALLSACGGGSSGTAATDTTGTTDGGSTTTTATTTTDTSVKTGVFIDAPVKGLTYKTATQSGVTNDKGEFKYITGETVTFSLDGVEIGSGTAQAKLPVTLISTEDLVAQLLQTMDTDANPDLIDVSKIKLSTSNKTDLKALIANKGECSKIKCLETILDTATLTKIQTDSQVALVNQKVVASEVAGAHVFKAVGSTPWQTSEVSGMVSVDDGEISIFNTDGTFSINSNDGGDIFHALGTWQLSGGQLMVNFTADGKSQQYKIHKISQDGDTLDVYSESTTDAADTNLFEFYKAKPLTLAALNGKHLSFDMTGNAHCTAMTISFSGATATLRDKCGGQYEEAVGTAEAVAGTQNLIKFGLGDKYMLMAISSGDVSKGRMTRANIKGSTLGGIDVSNFTAVSAPLQP